MVLHALQEVVRMIKSHSDLGTAIRVSAPDAISEEGGCESRIVARDQAHVRTKLLTISIRCILGVQDA